MNSLDSLRTCGLLLAMIASVLFCSATTFGQVTWDGSDADWSTDASWLPGGVQPTAIDNAIIDVGTVSLTQTGELSNGLTVGDTGTATLNIQGGGQLSSDGVAYLGKQTNSQGSVLIDGAGSRWEMDERDQDLVIGDEGTGTLTVQNGGAFEILELDKDVILGAQSGASGSITVTGSGSTWTSGGDFVFVGNHGQGTFLAEAGAMIENRSRVYIGYLGGTGEVTVTGAGTTWDVTGAGFHIGSAGNGTLRVLDGAVVNSAFFGVLGLDGETGNGQVIVDGAGSSWTTGASLRLGGAGTGTVTITNGGSVAVNTGGLNSEDSWILNGSSVTVDAGSLTYGEPFRITEGTLDLAAGSSFSGTDINIGTAAPGFGEEPPIAKVTVDNSTWTNSDELSVGFDGEGTLLAQNGSALISRLVIVGETGDGDGDATITGVGSSWTVNEQLTVGRSGIGELNVEAGATMSSPFTVVGATSNGVGQITVTGSGSSLDAGDLIAGRFSSGQATIDVEAGATLTTQNTTMGESASAVGTVNVTGAGSLWTNTGDLTIGILGTASVSATNGGQIQVDGLTTIGAGSTLVLNGGTLSMGMFDPSAGTFNFTDGILSVNTFEGTLDQQGGTLAPGQSPGITHVTSDYSFSAGTIDIELASSDGVAGIDFDQVTVGGSATIAGDLAIRLLDFVPKPLDTFTILTAGTLDGSFGNVANGERLATEGGEGSFLVSFDTISDTVVLSNFSLAGDYNNDGTVDLADYTVWRDNLGSPAGTLLNDIVGGTIDSDQYLAWKANFGASLPPAILASTSVPEPSACVHLILLLLTSVIRKR